VLSGLLTQLGLPPEIKVPVTVTTEETLVFEVTVEAARAAGLAGRRRVLDSTPLYDAVATMDTVTLVRSAIRGLLRACDRELAGELRGVLRRDDD
jgi:hypothetical protein